MEMINISFNLNEKESKMARKFIKRCFKENKEDVGAIGGRFNYIINPTGVGVGITIMDTLTGEIKDVTDYDSW